MLITLKTETACWREQHSQVLALSRKKNGVVWTLIFIFLSTPLGEKKVSRDVCTKLHFGIHFLSILGPPNAPEINENRSSR